MNEFSAYKGWAIPEGNVVQVADELGNVLWKAAPSVATVLIIGSGVGAAGNIKDKTLAKAVVDGVTYAGMTKLSVPIGTVISFEATTTTSVFKPSISYNDEVVSNAATAQYELTVLGDITVTLSVYDPSGTGSLGCGRISIEDGAVPDGLLVGVSVSGNQTGHASIEIDGTAYANTAAIFVPSGTVITCKAAWGMSGATWYGGTISVNGEIVAERTIEGSSGVTTFNYTVLGDVSIELVSQRVQTGSSTYMTYGSVSITEQAPVSGGKVILEVEKITHDTYAGETTYTAEEFILLDIYPKTNGTVSVTYGGLTKTITDTSGAAEPNAQQVFFGTFNGVTDEVATPASGELTIEGDYYAFTCGSFASGGKYHLATTCKCITNIHEWGSVNNIPNNAFSSVTGAGGGLKGDLLIPSTITSIGVSACVYSYRLTNVIIGDGINYIGYSAFLMAASEDNPPQLQTVTMLAKMPPTLQIFESSLDGGSYYNNFGIVTNQNSLVPTIIVPKGCGATYKAAEGWSTYADYIVEAS